MIVDYTIGIFGSNGMLGRYVSKYLSTLPDYSYIKKKIINFTREDFDLSDYNNFDKIDDLIKDCTHIINCAGSIKPIVTSQNFQKTLLINSVFPNYLAKKCKQKNIKLYHITTDCVFDGLNGPYNEDDIFSWSSDDYASTKWLGESELTSNIRTSIIGEEVYNKRSLLEWAKSKKDSYVEGYTNHHWNGLTCLELAKYLNHLIDKDINWNGVRHIYSDDVTKFELLLMISYHFNLGLRVAPTPAPVSCDRRLRSNYDLLNVQPLDYQIKELVEFHEILYSN